MIRFLVFMILFSLIACNKIEVKKEFYNSGNLQYEKYYNKKEDVDSIIEYAEKSNEIIAKYTNIRKNKREARYFYDDAVIYGEEVLIKGEFYKNGWWLENNGNNLTKVEFISVGDTLEIPNQRIVTDSTGKINKNLSYYYSLSIPDTIEIAKNYDFEVELFTSIKGIKSSFASVLVLSDEIKADNSNYWTAKKTYDITEMELNKWRVRNKFNKKGDFFLRGFIVYFDVLAEDVGKDSIEFTNTINKIHINKKLFIL